MDTKEGWPEIVAALEDFLKEVGLECERREEGASFGNKLLQYGDKVVMVRVVSDRGVWFIEVAGSQAQPVQWYDVAILRDLLAGPGEDVLPLQAQVDFLEKHWSNVVERLSPPELDDSAAQLAVLRHERARRRFPGFFPPGDPGDSGENNQGA